MVVHAHVHGAAYGVVHVYRRVIAGMRPTIGRSVVVAVVGVQPCRGVGRNDEVAACRLGSLLPELAVLLGHFCPVVEEGGKHVGRVGEAVAGLVGHERHKVVAAVEEVIYPRLLAVVVHRLLQYHVCLFGIFRLVPSFCGEEEGCGVVYLAIRGVAASKLRAVGLALPAEESVPCRAGGIGHVAF